jgi:hypothetical protein
MLELIQSILEQNENVARNFEFDYILFDALFLAIWIVLLIWQKRFRPLKAGLILAIIIYLIDAIIWTRMGVREYGLPAPWFKYPVDFMMDVSYSIIAWSWLWIVFERRSFRDVALWTVLLFAGWLILPFVSRWIPLSDLPIMTNRHMSSRVWLHVTVVVIGYVALFLLGYDWKTILYVFWAGCMLAFAMEFSLYISGIRPTDVTFLVYETLILTNLGVPYLFIIDDKILPLLSRRLAVRKAT